MSTTIIDADLNDYLYFAETVTHGGFAAASRALKVPKSKLSRRIAGLEARLGVRLIERSTRKFRVTDLGQSFYQRCRAIIEVAEEAEAIVAESRTEPYGDLRLSCPTGLVHVVAPALSPFLRQFPKVRVQLLAIDRPVDLIQEGVDLAIRVRVKLDDSTTLAMRSLGVSRKMLVASPELAAKLSDDIASLAAAPTLSTDDEPGDAQWILQGPDGAVRKIRHEPRMRCSDFAVIRAAAVEGLGVALLPDHDCRDLIARGALAHLFPQWSSPEGLVHLLFTRRRGLPIAVRALIDHLVAACRPVFL